MQNTRQLLSLSSIYLSFSPTVRSRGQQLFRLGANTIRIGLQTITIRTMVTIQQEYRLKLDDTEFRNGQKKEVEVEGIEGAKVLLVKVNDQLRALGPKCTREFSPVIAA